MTAISAFLCSLSLLILYVSGWFSCLDEAFQTTRSNMKFVLITMVFLSLCDPWKVNSNLYIHPAWIGFFLIFIHIARNLPLDLIVTLISSSFCTGTLFLFGHEWIKANMDWTYKPFRIMLFLGLILFSIFISPRLPERIWFAGMSLMTLYTWILYFHQNGFTPVVLGSNVFMDVLWLSFIGIISVCYLEGILREWLKTRFFLSKF